MIETYDLSKHFGDFKAVDGVTLTVKPGQILALLGQNGAGKTTTVRMLTALLNPTRGWAKINGYDVVKQGANVRATVGVLTEQHGLYVRMTGQEYLDFFGQVYRLDAATRKSRIDYLLAYFGLSEAANQRVGEYSKGMRQKLALARALMHEPSVLLLDEPTSAMDPESARLVRDEISRLKSSQRSIIICTHNLAEAESLADIIAIIYRGRILLSGSLDDLKSQILGPVEYEARLAHPWRLDGLILPEGVAISGTNGGSLRFLVERPRDINPTLLRQLIEAHAPIVSLQEVPRSLEQVYLKVMANVQAPVNTIPLPTFV
jgi:ABC-2 type transport system ATP-binding protein